MAGAMNGHIAIVKFLVSKGHSTLTLTFPLLSLLPNPFPSANVRLCDRSGLTALHHAAASGSRELCDLLIPGSVLNQKNLRGGSLSIFVIVYFDHL